MITNEDKIGILLNKLNNVDLMVQSYINNAENLKDKYSLQEELDACNFEKSILLQLLDNLQ